MPEVKKQKCPFYVEALFELLGIAYATGGDKAPDFSERFKSSGLQFDTLIQRGMFSLCSILKLENKSLQQWSPVSLEPNDQI